MPKICLMCGDNFPDTTTFCPKDGSALRAAVQGDDLIGELIAERYLITDLLSQGGMGAVYLASDVRLPQQFAVKVLKQSKAPDPSLIQRFRQEAEAVCRINHDRVARVFDFGFMVDDRAYIIMEYVAGRTLKHLIEERGAVDPVEAAKITLMAAEGIDAAHRLGIVHRDLKPENVMILDDPGGGMRVKVLDFGIAKLQNAEADQGYTQPGFVIGTPAWMSPEQLTGGALDPRSDIYSLGLVAFALLTGARAFTGENEQSEMLARITVAPRTLAAAAPQVAWPADLQDLFDRTLSREANQRPNTAVQFATAMLDAAQQWHEREHPRAKTVVSGERSVALTPPGVAPSKAAATPVVSSAASSAAALSPAPQSSSGSKTMIMGLGAAALVGVIVLAVVWKSNSGAPAAADATTQPPISAPPVVVAPKPGTPAPVDSPPSSAAPVGGAPVGGTPVGGTPVGGAPVGGAPVSKPVEKKPKPVVDVPSKPTTSASVNADLQAVMDDFDRDGSPSRARDMITKIGALNAKLSNVDRGWAQIYLGLAHLTLNDKAQACAAFKQAMIVGGDSKLVKSDAEEKMLLVPCRP